MINITKKSSVCGFMQIKIEAYDNFQFCRNKIIYMYVESHHKLISRISICIYQDRSVRLANLKRAKRIFGTASQALKLFVIKSIYSVLLSPLSYKEYDCLKYYKIRVVKNTFIKVGNINKTILDSEKSDYHTSITRCHRL